jgi:hypothetical protein
MADAGTNRRDLLKAVAVAAASAALRPVLAGAQARLMNWYINTTGVPPTDRDPRPTPPYYPMPEPSSDPGAPAQILDQGATRE